jgi:SPP1 family predicted phage head-tail adaptor
VPVNVQAGQLRNRIRFERRGTPVSDSAGNQVSAWETAFERWVSLKGVPATGASPETVVQGRLTGQAFFTIIVRHDYQTETLTADDRAVNLADGQVYNIRSAIDLDGDRRWITIDAQKGVAT